MLSLSLFFYCENKSFRHLAFQSDQEINSHELM